MHYKLHAYTQYYVLNTSDSLYHYVISHLLNSATSSYTCQPLHTPYLYSHTSATLSLHPTHLYTPHISTHIHLQPYLHTPPTHTHTHPSVPTHIQTPALTYFINFPDNNSFEIDDCIIMARYCFMNVIFRCLIGSLSFLISFKLSNHRLRAKTRD